ncbi:hypothetical protein RIR_jg31572.t1 [Rhizophagus irregularis DAOM 181602=DAOM 197198]|nr:hypothetical protein RIR_jg31572.t1 [Rhizophagus irregularis DAOM 181602=DAOM 197198]
MGPFFFVGTKVNKVYKVQGVHLMYLVCNFFYNNIVHIIQKKTILNLIISESVSIKNRLKKIKQKIRLKTLRKKIFYYNLLIL